MTFDKQSNGRRNRILAVTTDIRLVFYNANRYTHIHTHGRAASVHLPINRLRSSSGSLAAEIKDDPSGRAVAESEPVHLILTRPACRRARRVN